MARSANVVIVVRCHRCGDVRVRVRVVTLRHCLDDDTWTYWFVCPSCGQRSAAQTNREASLQAIAAGAVLEPWRLPAELEERSNEAPALNGLDVLEFHLGLIEPDWIDELL
jgi:hypothetical protein